MHKVDASRLNLARQFRARPFGPHGSELQKLLKILLGPDRGPHHRGSAATRRGLATGPEHRSQGASDRDLRWARVCHTGRGAMGHFPPALGTPYRPGALPGGQRASSDCRPSEHRCEPSFRPGLSDRFSVEAGGSIAFNAQAPYHAAIERLRCGDEGGVGLKATPINTPVNGDYAGRRQAVTCGSYIEIDDADAFALSEFTLLAYIWPTTPRLRRRQVLLGGRDYALRIDEGGMLPVSVGGSTLAAGRPLLERHWHLVAASFDGDTRRDLGSDNGRCCATLLPVTRRPRPPLCSKHGRALAAVSGSPPGSTKAAP